MTDITVIDNGSIVLLQPNTDEARAWIDENIGPDNGYQPYYPTVTCERNYFMGVLFGMQESGLTLETEGREFTLEPA